MGRPVPTLQHLGDDRGPGSRGPLNPPVGRAWPRPVDRDDHGPCLPHVRG